MLFGAEDDVSADLVSEVAGARLAEAEPLLTGLAEAVLGRITLPSSMPIWNLAAQAMA